MGMTMTQKILAAAAGLESVQAGQLIEADLDLVLGNDIYAMRSHICVDRRPFVRVKSIQVGVVACIVAVQILPDILGQIDQLIHRPCAAADDLIRIFDFPLLSQPLIEYGRPAHSITTFPTEPLPQ